MFNDNDRAAIAPYTALYRYCSAVAV